MKLKFLQISYKIMHLSLPLDKSGSRAAAKILQHN